ncbi:MAG: MATE family efflux transporter [Spirochaetes bacterium]|uniref:MATE family efflux transporter n=1 Tax=Candidatus Ornithospirochaeta stercoripullorum TaxID=2840899 RepID=A0A9D9DZ85_9SPIO|nr:MATE family efflux transporter [Candidatus Ornithospirochaeta stercoripullorum]
MGNEIKENIMGYETIPSLIMKLSLPLMLSMLIQALYNVVDSIFVARVSETALTAVSLAFPLQSLMIAFGIGTAVGVNSYLARKLGEKRQEEAEAAADNGLFLAILTWLAFALFGLFGTKPFISIFTDDPEIISLTWDYASICLIFSFGIFIDITAERIMQATGDSIHPMITQSLGAITNIILDPVFIFGFGMGVKGAAIATVIGQIVSMIFALYFVKKNKYVSLHLSLKKFRPSGKIIKEIYSVGIPTIIMNSVGTVSVSAMNSILISFTPTAVSVLGVYFKLQSFIFMPVFGLQAGMIPIIAYNYGARKKTRMTSTLKTGGTIAVLIMVLGFLLFQFCPSFLLSLFAASDEMLKIGIRALRIISLCFIPAAISISVTSVFQATGVGYAAMIVSIVRQIIVLLPVAWLLKATGILDNVWLSYAIAEIFGLTCSVLFYIHVYRKKIKPIES